MKRAVKWQLKLKKRPKNNTEQCLSSKVSFCGSGRTEFVQF